MHKTICRFTWHLGASELYSLRHCKIAVLCGTAKLQRTRVEYLLGFRVSRVIFTGILFFFRSDDWWKSEVWVLLWFLVRFKSGIGGNHHILDTLRLLDLFFLNSGLEFNHCGGKICCRFIGDFWSFIIQERRRSDCFLSDILENFSHFLIVGDESYDSHLRFTNRTLQRINLKNLLDQPGPGRTDL